MRQKHTTFYCLKRSALIFFFLGNLCSVFSQDVQFSQYYNLPQLMNPSFVGTSYAWRAIAHSRLQWPGLEAKYTTLFASADYNWRKYNNGIGIFFMHDNQGSANIKTNMIALQYANYVNISEKFTLRGGLQISYNSRTLDNTKLTYPNQFTGNDFDKNIDAGLDKGMLTKNFIDVSPGIVFYTGRFWTGLAMFHLNKPNQSFIGKSEKIDIRYDITGGYKFVLKKNATMRYLEPEDEEVMAITPTYQYKAQGKADQLDLGMYFTYRYLLTGIWYRGIPFKNYNNRIINNESIVLLAGLKYDQISFAYSYDIIVSKLRGYALGAHEINITVLFPKYKNFKPKKNFKKLPCPDFMK